MLSKLISLLHFGLNELEIPIRNNVIKRMNTLFDRSMRYVRPFRPFDDVMHDYRWCPSLLFTCTFLNTK